MAACALGAVLAGPAAADSTTTPGTPGARCGAVLGPAATWLPGPTCEVTIPKGSTVSIALSSHYRWGALVAKSAVVGVTSTRPAKGGLTGTLRGRRLGVTTVTSIGGPICGPGVACPDFLLRWSLRVKVVTPTTLPAALVVTQADAAGVKHLHVGEHLVVRLTASAGYAWTVPTTTDSSVLQVVSASPGQATFAALGPGSATVTSTENPTCYPSCLPPSRILQIRVTVS
ncbi:MAG: hypothetical protein ACRDV0_01640 [Acidimicrobiales bacterium]